MKKEKATEMPGPVITHEACGGCGVQGLGFEVLGEGFRI
jgi:hypothetical protein